MGLLKPPKDQSGLAGKPRPTILRKIEKRFQRRPKSKTQREVEKELRNGFRGLKRFMKETVEYDG